MHSNSNPIKKEYGKYMNNWFSAIIHHGTLLLFIEIRSTAYFFRFFILSRYTDMNIKLYCVHLNFISDFIQPNQHKTVTTIHSIVFDALWEPKSNTNSIFCIFIICSNQILFYFFWFTSIPWQKLTAFSTIKMTKSSFFPFFSF